MVKPDKKLKHLSNDERRDLLKAMYLDIFTFAEILFGDKDNSMHYHIRNKSPEFHREIAQELLKMKSGDKKTL